MYLKISLILAQQENWNWILLFFFQEFRDNKILQKTEPHEACDLSQAYFHLGVCQGVRVP